MSRRRSDDTRVSGKLHSDTSIGKEIRLTRRLLVNWLLAAGGASATAAVAQDRKKPVVIDKPVGQTIQEQFNSGKGLAEQTTRPGFGNFATAIKDATDFTMLRPRDLMVLNVRLVNMKVTGSAKTRRIQKIDPASYALMIVEHQPQAIVERTWPDLNDPNMPDISRSGQATGGKDGGAPGAIHSNEIAETYIAGPSRLSYKAPSGFTSMPFTVAEVLNACATWKLNLDTRALDAPSADVMPSAHAFDRIRTRLTAISNQQKDALRQYGPKTEALLRRIAKRIAEAITQAAASGKQLSDAAIDKLIAYEIKATLTPNARRSDKDDGDPFRTPGTKTASLYVATLATQELATMPLFMVDGVSVASMVFADTKPRPIGENATDIEVPYRLHMSPLSTAGFAHATEPVDHDGDFAELWHTRMGTRVDDWVIGDNPEPMRALHADDLEGFAQKHQDQSGPWALDSLDRTGIVRLTSSLKGGYVSLPVMAKYLRMTALGASFDAEGRWPNPTQVDSNIEQWKHISSIGRDQFVRVVYAGYLFPFGHAASLIKVSERKFTRQSDGGRVAGLMQKYYIIVRQRTRSFPGDAQRFDARDFPFSSIEITTAQTPDLKAPEQVTSLSFDTYYKSNKNRFFETFWPKLSNGGQDMLFHIIATDTAGRKTVLDMPLMFVAATRNEQSSVEGIGETLVPTHSHVEAICQAYNSTTETRRRFNVNASVIRFSRDIDAAGNVLPPGESDYPAQFLSFESWPATASIKGPRFYPRLASAEIEVPSVQTMVGKKIAPKVVYHKRFLTAGFGADNAAQVVLGFDAPINASGVTDKFGGIVDPGLFPEGLSRKLGVLSDVDAYLDADFDLGKALGGAKLLGVVPLGDILKSAGAFEGFDGKNVPKLTTVNTEAGVVTSYMLEKKVITESAGVFIPLPPSSSDPQLSIRTTVTVDKTGKPPVTKVEAKLNWFKINLFGFIILTFDKLDLTVQPGSKTDINPVLNLQNGVLFGGPLEFLNSMKDVIPMDGFADPPAIDVSPAGISAAYSMGLPDIGVGALTLQNVSLGAGFDLPFTGGGPSARFNFAERHNPFNLTVSMFGGGGFFAIALDTGGVRELEACLEFGAQISIDLGVASGGVYVKGGFYFHWQKVPKELIEFEGYVEMGGHLSVLGLITVSLVFHLGLTYEKTGGKARLYGTATLTVEIDILFFSCSQDVTVEREFAGSDADPLFVEFAPPDLVTGEGKIWNDYCAAFA